MRNILKYFYNSVFKGGQKNQVSNHLFLGYPDHSGQTSGEDPQLSKSKLVRSKNSGQVLQTWLSQDWFSVSCMGANRMSSSLANKS